MTIKLMLGNFIEVSAASRKKFYRKMLPQLTG